MREALKDGFVSVEMFLCILVGLPGVGKTHLKFLLLNKLPPRLRTSTNCAEAPIRIEIRTITGTRLQTFGGQWKEVDNTEMYDIVAQMIIVAESNDSNPPLDQVEEERTPKQTMSIVTRIISWMKQHSSKSATAPSVQGAYVQFVSPKDDISALPESYESDMGQSCSSHNKVETSRSCGSSIFNP